MGDSPRYPAAPWAMHGSLWLTVLRLGRPGAGADGPRPAGIYGAAFVSYGEGSVLTYSELLLARALRRGEGRGRRFTITDIWVDSPASMVGGRELWAIPKGLCDFDLDSARRGPVSSTVVTLPTSTGFVECRHLAVSLRDGARSWWVDVAKRCLPSGSARVSVYAQTTAPADAPVLEQYSSDYLRLGGRLDVGGRIQP